jgi:hypothetical protein
MPALRPIADVVKTNIAAIRNAKTKAVVASEHWKLARSHRVDVAVRELDARRQHGRSRGRNEEQADIEDPGDELKV